MTQLRQRMIDEMRRRNFAEKSIKVYVDAIAKLALYSKRSPETLGVDDIRQFQLHLRDEKKLAWSTYNGGSSACPWAHATWSADSSNGASSNVRCRRAQRPSCSATSTTIGTGSNVS